MSFGLNGKPTKRARGVRKRTAGVRHTTAKTKLYSCGVYRKWCTDERSFEIHLRTYDGNKPVHASRSGRIAEKPRNVRENAAHRRRAVVFGCRFQVDATARIRNDARRQQTVVVVRRSRDVHRVWWEFMRQVTYFGVKPCTVRKWLLFVVVFRIIIIRCRCRRFHITRRLRIRLEKRKKRLEYKRV